MTPYQEAKYSLEGKAIEIASQLRSMEEQMDTVQKVNIFLMRKYRDELLAEFGELATEYKETCKSLFGEKPPKEFEDALVIRHLFDQIAKVMSEQMPDPWYMYGFFGGGEVAND